MTPAAVVKFRPTAPWRIGDDSGLRDRVQLFYRSDALYSAVTHAMGAFGGLDEWLAATARASVPEVAFSSVFPFQGDLVFVSPPRTIWPPALSPKVRWKGASLVPLDVVDALLAGDSLDETLWAVDGSSECLIPVGRYGPFRIAHRTAAAVDRLTGALDPHRTACLEFAAGAGMWCAISFASEEAGARWLGPVQAAFRYLADTGLGGERSRGWGRFDNLEFLEGTLPSLLLPRSTLAAESAAPPAERLFWLLSLFVPSAGDAVRWDGGSYQVVTRAGRVDAAVSSGGLKKLQNMVAEGSVLAAGAPLIGSAPDVAPDDFPHPVYRCGFAVAVPLPAPAAAPQVVS
ncbi:MAG: type III-A CRISPR-associated RAMP protein Csm4 [Bryobacteraceae bacterium]